MRPLLFLFGCIGVRAAITYLAGTASEEKLKLMGKIALIPALGFLLIWTMRWRRTGPETFGAPIWWDSLRPVHAALWGAFAVLALRGNKNAYIFLAADTALGLIVWARRQQKQTTAGKSQ